MSGRHRSKLSYAADVAGRSVGTDAAAGKTTAAKRHVSDDAMAGRSEFTLPPAAS
jgi:hypothetical protein